MRDKRRSGGPTTPTCDTRRLPSADLRAGEGDVGGRNRWRTRNDPRRRRPRRMPAPCATTQGRTGRRRGPTRVNRPRTTIGWGATSARDRRRATTRRRRPGGGRSIRDRRRAGGPTTPTCDPGRPPSVDLRAGEGDVGARDRRRTTNDTGGDGPGGSATRNQRLSGYRRRSAVLGVRRRWRAAVAGRDALPSPRGGPRGHTGASRPRVRPQPARPRTCVARTRRVSRAARRPPLPGTAPRPRVDRRRWPCIPAPTDRPVSPCGAVPSRTRRPGDVRGNQPAG